MNAMAKQKPKSSNERYRKPRRIAGIPESLAKQIDILVERNQSDFTEEVRNAVREYLEKRGLWPIPKDKKAE